MADLSKNPIIRYFQESYDELMKVTWPTRNQAIKLTFIVIGFCIVLSAVVGVLDYGFNYGYRELVLYADKVAPQQVTAPPLAPLTAEASPAVTVTPSTQEVKVINATTQQNKSK